LKIVAPLTTPLWIAP